MSDELKGTLAIVGGVVLLLFVGSNGLAMTLLIAMAIPLICCYALLNPFGLLFLFWTFIFKNVFNNNTN